MILLVEVLDDAFCGRRRTGRFQLGVARPVRRGREALQQPGAPEHERSGAHRSRVRGRRVGVANPVQHPLVVHEGASADAAGKHDDVGLGHLLEGCVDGDAEETVLAANFAALMTDEGDVDRRNALQHFVRADGVERREAREEGDRDLHGWSLFLGGDVEWPGVLGSRAESAPVGIRGDADTALECTSK